MADRLKPEPCSDCWKRPARHEGGEICAGALSLASQADPLPVNRYQWEDWKQGIRLHACQPVRFLARRANVCAGPLSVASQADPLPVNHYQWVGLLIPFLALLIRSLNACNTQSYRQFFVTSNVFQEFVCMPASLFVSWLGILMQGHMAAIYQWTHRRTVASSRHTAHPWMCKHKPERKKLRSACKSQACAKLAQIFIMQPSTTSAAHVSTAASCFHSYSD